MQQTGGNLSLWLTTELLSLFKRSTLETAVMTIDYGAFTGWANGEPRALFRHVLFAIVLLDGKIIMPNSFSE